MSGCIYYMKAVWQDEKAAQEALPTVEALLKRLYEAEEAFQDNRPGREVEARQADAALRARFPDLVELGLFGEESANKIKGIESLNYLANKLCSPFKTDGWEVWSSREKIGFQGTVWHYADWDPLAEALRKLGAVEAGWISEESIEQDVYSLIEMF